MKTREVAQVEIWGLILNTFGSAESGALVALATTEESLRCWYEEQKLEKSEKIGELIYSFKENSPIRNYNPLYNWLSTNEDVFGHGFFSQWVNENELNQSVYRVDF